jgi:hypothetical protein
MQERKNQKPGTSNQEAEDSKTGPTTTRTPTLSLK